MYDLRELAIIARLRKGTEEHESDYDIGEIARLYLNRILALQPQGPYVVAGFSAGGAVAFAVAHGLRELGHEYQRA